MAMEPAVLVIEDEAGLARNICTYLGRQGFEARQAATGAEALAAVEEFKPDVILLDYQLPDTNGLELLARIRAVDAGVPVVIITGAGSVQTAVDAMKAGAQDYLAKPLVLKELYLLLQRLTSQERLQGALQYYRQRDAEDSGLARLVGESAPMQRLKQQVRALLEAEARLAEGPPPTVLITGETGTGKELVARAFHHDGARRAGEFVEINCGAIPAHLLEAELFGYERGAFTDARERKIGLAEAAHGGTLFLDEVGDVEQAVQVKLLKLLEDHSVRRLGGLRDRTVDLRVIAATNRPLEQLVQEGLFRSDLYYRLRVVQLVLPPLRDRGDDILLLARHMLELHARRYQKRGLELSREARDALLAYRWPGNVRELRNVMEQAVLMAPGPVIGPDLLPLVPAGAGADPAAAARPPAGESLNLEATERRLLTEALERTGGNVTRAAALLGLTRDALRYRLDKHNLRS